MGLKETLDSDYVVAMKAKDKLRVSTIRLMLAEIKNEEIAKRDKLDEEELLGIVAREARKRRESIAEFEKGGRQDLVDKEKRELTLIEAYLPEQLTEEEVRSMVDETIEEVGAASAADLGKVMGKLMPRLKGKFDGKKANQIVREALEG
jgi:hypothetical protein